MAKKSLGQNFLRNQHLAEQIVALADLQSDDRVLEIGPGQGILTDIIAEKIGADGLFLAVEKDWTLAEKLKKKYKNRKNIKIICADVLEIADELAESLGENYKLISNLPYNISNLILNRFYFGAAARPSPRFRSATFERRALLGDRFQVPASNFSSEKFAPKRSAKNSPPKAGKPCFLASAIYLEPSRLAPAFIAPQTAVLMVQKEVAERLTARPGEKARGIPTVLLENVAEAKIAINHIKPGAFSPAPAVESAVLVIRRRLKMEDRKLNPIVVKAGFSAKRQKLVNSLSRGLKMPKNEISAIIKEAGINENLRAEDLTLENWQKLSEEIYVFLGGIGK